MAAWEDYFWPGTEVLRNRLGIRDAKTLERVEHELTAGRRVQLEQGRAPIDDTFDANHLRSLHRWLTQDIYDWAGEYRTVELAKLTSFARVDQIASCLDTAAHLVQRARWDELDDRGFAEHAAEVYGWVNYAHPFRDVNGRSARAFMSAVARRAGRYLDYSAVSRAVWVQRASFSVPDLDQERPQHEWMVPVFAAVSRPRVHWTARELTGDRSIRRGQSGYELGS